MDFEFEINGQLHKITIEKKDNKLFIMDANKNLIEVNCQIISKNCLSLLINNESYTIYFAESDKKWYLVIRDEEYIIESPSTVKKKASQAELAEFSENMICAPMPGKILKINVNGGARVKKKQSLVIIEAMKMEHDIRAPFDAIVTKVNFKEGQIVDTETPIIELEKIIEEKSD